LRKKEPEKAKKPLNRIDQRLFVEEEKSRTVERRSPPVPMDRKTKRPLPVSKKTFAVF
jgi:hypothetical protein